MTKKQKFLNWLWNKREALCSELNQFEDVTPDFYMIDGHIDMIDEVILAITEDRI